MPALYSDEFRQINMERAQSLLDRCCKDYGIEAAEYISSVMFMGFYTSALFHSLPPNAVLRDFDARVEEMRHRLLMVVNGKLKPGELGPR